MYLKAILRVSEKVVLEPRVSPEHTSKYVDTVAEFRSVVKDTKSNTKNFTKSISIHSDYQSVHFW